MRMANAFGVAVAAILRRSGGKPLLLSYRFSWPAGRAGPLFTAFYAFICREGAKH